MACVSLGAHQVPASPQEGLEVGQGDEVNNSLWEGMLVPQWEWVTNSAFPPFRHFEE